MPVSSEDNAGSKRVKFVSPNQTATLRSHSWATKQPRPFDIRSDNGSDADLVREPKYSRVPKMGRADPLVVYQDKGNKMHTADGRDILVIGRPDLSSVPEATGSNNAWAKKRDSIDNVPFATKGPLQPASGNSGFSGDNQSQEGRPWHGTLRNHFHGPQQNQLHGPGHHSKNPSHDTAFSSPGAIQGDNRSPSEQDPKSHNNNWNLLGRGGTSASVVNGNWNSGPGINGSWNSNVQGLNDKGDWWNGNNDNGNQNTNNRGMSHWGNDSQSQVRRRVRRIVTIPSARRMSLIEVTRTSTVTRVLITKVLEVVIGEIKTRASSRREARARQTHTKPKRIKIRMIARCRKAVTNGNPQTGPILRHLAHLMTIDTTTL